MEPRSPGRILVRGTNWLGDAVMTTPALLRLREKFPDSHITLLTPEKLEQLWINHPAVNETISFKPEESVFAVVKKLRTGKFDTALVLPNSPRSAIEIFLAGIPVRIGYARPWRNFFLTQKIAPRPESVKMHKRTVGEIKQLINASKTTQNTKSKTQNSSANQACEYLHLAAALGSSPEPLPTKLFVTTEETEAVKKKFGLASIPNPIFGLNPGAEYGPAKRWPVEKFIAAAKEIQKQINCAWILFGSKNDGEFTNQIESAIRNTSPAVLNLAGKTSLRELMSLLKLCRVFLTNDTGPMHVATALDVPTVAIFGSTSPELTAPLSPESHFRILSSDAPCSPCFLRECPIDFRCMNGISIERVVQTVVKSLKL